ncbi:MAG TPA: DNA polymerase III subunit gamma/tau [Kofleriaceae bacterium]|nr:DNA polymerase III subunit gamma/tau [Kofleriaceae bacterium]
MSYLVLARKYRPSTFSEVVGQEHVTRTLGNAFATGRVHHAFLFCGPRGCGKTTVARIVGKALNCTNHKAGDHGEPCGTCDACVSISNGSAVDYQEMDGASNRGIDAIRELTEAVRYQPAVLKKKVYVIDEVHMLTTEAFNALLKTLEEPPPHVTFVLATTEPHKLPNTILSRCQRYDFKLVPASRLAQHLATIFAKEALAIEPNAVSLLVRESGGSVRDALSLSDQIISYVGGGTITEQHVAEVLGVADRSLTRTLVTSLASGDAGAALSAVESAIERGVDEVQLARAIVRYLRDLAVLHVAPQRTELVDASDEERAELASEAAAIDRSRVQQMFDRMLRCCDELGKTLQPRLVLDCALIDVATIEPLIPLGDLIERLGELEGRVARGAPARASGGTHGGGELKGTTPGTRGGPARPPATQQAKAPAPAPKHDGETFATTIEASAAPAVPVAIAPSAPVPVAIAPSAPVPAPPTTDKVASGSGPHAPALAVPNNAAEALVAWSQVIDYLEAQRRISLRGYYEFARVLKWTKDELELGFAPDGDSAWAGENACEKPSVDELRGVLAELGQKLKVSARMLDASEAAKTPARSLVESTRASTTAERSKREAEAREHPITKHVLQTFGAHIKEIKTDV